MLKRLAILAVLIAFASFVWVAATQNVPSNTPKKGIVEGNVTAKTQPSTKGQHENQSAPNPPSVVVQVETPTIESNRPDSHEDEATKELAGFTFWLMIFTAGLMVVGFLQLCAMGLQAFILHRQSTLMGEHAAYLQAIAVIAGRQTNYIAAAERAWLSVSMGDAKLPIEDISDDFKVGFTPRITNSGRTVAHITKMYLRVRFCNSVGGFDNPPRYEEEDRPDDESSRSFGGKIFDEDILTVPNAIVMPISVNMNGQEFRRMKDGENIKLFLYGYVEYRTIGHPVCLTGFCLQYHLPGASNNPIEGLPKGWVIYGPSGYNYAK
jgi:hypothetical protein